MRSDITLLKIIIGCSLIPFITVFFLFVHIQWQKIKSIGARTKSFALDNLASILAISIGIVGFIMLIYGFNHVHESYTWTTLVTDLYANGGSEFISIAITALVLETANRRRATQERKKQLFRQLKSRSNDFAVDALRQIQDENWWEDALKHHRGEDGVIDLQDVRWAGGVNLRGVNLEGANLNLANLAGGDLQTNIAGADLQRVNFKNAYLRGTNLRNAYLNLSVFEGAELVSANLEDTKLNGAILIGAVLLSANLKGAELGAALFYTTTVLPDSGWVVNGGNIHFTKYWTPETDMSRYTNPEHPDFWQPESAKNRNNKH